MQDNYQAALNALLVHEGGYVNDPFDPGGATNFGVTQRVYDAYRRAHALMTRPVRVIERSEVAEIYREQYARAVRFDDLPDGVDYAVFDYAVNSGVDRAVKALQRALGVTADGHIGLVTLGAAKAADKGTVINRICDGRLSFLQGLKTWWRFGRGWGRRVAEVRAFALKLARRT